LVQRRLGAWIRDAEHQMNIEMNDFARPYGLTGMQLSVIDFLSRSREQDVFQVDLEHEFHVQRSTASLLVKRMVERDLVTRVVAASDSRKRQLRLTAKGRGLVTIVQQHLVEQDTKIVAGLSSQEVAAFRRALVNVSHWNSEKE